MNKEYKLTTCGLSCDLCDSNTPKIQNAVKYLLKVFEDPMILGVIQMTNPEFKMENFPPFKETLEVLTNFPQCPGCQKRNDCVINQCASQKSIDSCAKCDSLDLESSTCKSLPEIPKVPNMPPAPIFFNGLSKRYQKWNVENLASLAKGNNEEISSTIEKMILEGKSNRDLIDFSVNLFDSKR